MTKDDILRMAREAGLIAGADMTSERNVLYLVALTNFAALVAAAEREACAKVCVANELIDWPTTVEIAAVCKCAKAIQARKP